MCDMKEQMREFIASRYNSRISAYEQAKPDIMEHYNIEQNILAGGNSYRQILELIQNGADAILESSGEDDKISILLTDNYLLAANTGAPITTEGVGALLSAFISTKSGNQIGRFGIGFKSLLRLGGIIDIITKDRDIIQFDPVRCTKKINEQFNVDEAPGLRLAWFYEELPQEDEHANSEYHKWAQTIVRADTSSIDDDFKRFLAKEIKEFHAEFLLFFDTTVKIDIGYIFQDEEDYNKQLALEINENNKVVLKNGDESTNWRRIKIDLPINSENALADATHIHARNDIDKYPLIWAIPEKSSSSGKFWAFFPLNTNLHLPGIMNAPWKINNDRTSLVDSGQWNTTLMQAAAELVVDTIPKLSTEDDPGKVLDYFPRQCGEDEIAWPLVDGVWKGLKGAECIPDATGALRFGSELQRHPEGIGQELVEQWCEIAGNESRMSTIHPTTMKGNRDSRLKALAEKIDGEHEGEPNLKPMEIGEWFSAVASVETHKAIEVLRLAVAYKEQCETQNWRNNRQQLEIIPAQNGELVSPDVAVFAPEGVEVPGGRFAVAKELAVNEEAEKLLKELGVRELDDEEWIKLLNQVAPNRYFGVLGRSDTDKKWNTFWTLLRRAPQKIVKEYIEKNSWIRVKRNDGEWVTADNTLLPGKVINENDEENSRLLINMSYHKSDNDIISIIGVSDYPSGIIGPDNWSDIKYTFSYDRWIVSNRNKYRDYLENWPTNRYLVPRSMAIPKGIGLLTEAKSESCSKLSVYYIKLLLNKKIDRIVEFGHKTRSYYYPTKHLPHPVRWLLLEHGTLQLGGQTVRLAAFREYYEHPAFKLLPDWEEEWEPKIRLFIRGDGEDEDILPAVQASDNDRKEFWQGLIEKLATEENLADDRLTPLWNGAAKAGVVPETINGQQLNEVYITTSPDLARLGRDNGWLVVTLDEEAFKSWKNQGAQDLDTFLKPTWEAEGSEEFLIEVFPDLEVVLTDEAKENARCREVTCLCIGLEGAEPEETVCLLENDVLLIDYAQLTAMQKDKGLTRILQEIASTGWLRNNVEQAKSTLLDPYRRRREVFQVEPLAEKLWLAVQEDNQILLRALGNPKFLKNNCDGVELAELVRKHHGVATLYALRDSLGHLDPPPRWNTGPAFIFVADLGFPEEYAKSANPKRDPEKLVDGPINLPPLHDYQEEVKSGIEGLLSNGEKRRRAVVSLPTGAGKTRVTVESAVEFVLKPAGGKRSRSVLWVAQSDELCEQAVSSFIRVWRNKGEEQKDLRIFRLWGGNPNPSLQSDDQPVVVVATVQTLNARMGQQELDWMRDPGLVVIDECHHAIAPSYTRVLNWLDAAAPMGREVGPEPPFIGLSATPFRVDDEESQRLARRYSEICLPGDQKGLYQQLSNPKQGVLSTIVNEEIKRKTALLEDEENKLVRYGKKGHNFEYTRLIERISERLTYDDDRNQELIGIVKNKVEEDKNVNSILLFANSVKHANEMAIRLNQEGISAAAISGNTPMVARRDFIERFQHDEIKVLTNYGVLTAGFDAPKVDMILISRLVYSPVSYMQMLGRGMRGPKMGGTARCLNVTLIDNHDRFIHKHPYYYFQRYYNRVVSNKTQKGK